MLAALTQFPTKRIYISIHLYIFKNMEFVNEKYALRCILTLIKKIAAYNSGLFGICDTFQMINYHEWKLCYVNKVA